MLAALALVTFAVRAAWFGDPNADIDEQLYSLIGLEMTHGALPYVDLWDRKPIGLFALFALAHLIGGPGPVAYQVLAALFTVGGAWMTYRLARSLVDRITALGAGLLYIFLLSIYGSQSGQAEAFFVPMMLCMALLVIDPHHARALQRSLIAMSIGGIALQVKYTVLPQCIFFGLWALWGQFRMGKQWSALVGQAVSFAALGILPTFLIGLAYGVAGHWDEFAFANFVSFFERLPANSGRIASGHLVFLLPVFGLLALGFYAAFRLSTPRVPHNYRFFVLWLGATVCTIYLPATVYLYYYASLAPVVALTSLPILDRKGAIGPIPLMLALIAFGYLQFLPGKYEKADEHREKMTSLAAAIKPRVSGNNCLYIFDGPTALYRMTNSCLPTRYIYPDHLNNAFERNSLGISQVAEVGRILAKKPPVIVTADTAFTPQNEESKALVWTTVKHDYVEIAMEELHKRKIRVWARRDTVPH
ncbi:ArnT family glycosyltransferase [Qipengyuania soli]|uniref:Glycosyltransferase family 39 protein n=1 Tax=Qipengyuania soli TaxID=2782568 RepID=A0A7S8ISC9_9SPHN|nr:glycosyltransferase family 39 protein [Qipengyuania soli]QPC97953.1 glycosyltransferase family 39 protein [Qipengyuania soli]